MTTARYSTGEEPRVGDVVQIVDPHGGHGWPVGDVDKVRALDFMGDPVVTRQPEGERYAYMAYRFALIARAGEPVKYQPGDVVECIEDFSIDVGRIGRGPHTVGRVAHDGWPVLWDREIDGPMRPERFRLVHRPVAPERGDPAEVEEKAEDPAPIRSIADVARDLRVGDRVRVVLEGTVDRLDENDSEMPFRLDTGTWPNLKKVTSLEVIERPEKPLAIGDRVYRTEAREKGVHTVVGIDREVEGEAECLRAVCVRSSDGFHALVPYDKLERAE